MTPPVVVGSASRDITPDDPRGWRLGGAAAYCGLTLARLGLRPRLLIGVDPLAADADELELLREAGAEVRLARLPTGPVFRNRATPTGRIQDCLEPGVPLDAAIPPAWSDADSWLLVPVADELDDRWASRPATGAFVAVGWQGLLRNLPRGGVVSRRPPTRGALIDRADLVILSREDVEPDTEPASLRELVPRAAMLVLTDGANGGSVWPGVAAGAPAVERYAAIASDVVVDPTGAGDAFLAGLVAARLGHRLAGAGDLGGAIRLAAAAASLTVEGPGLRGVPGIAAVERRLARRVEAGQGSPDQVAPAPTRAATPD